MEIKGNRYGGAFTVEASSTERSTILGAIAEVGLKGVDRDELRQDSGLTPKVVSAVQNGTDWDRRTLEVVNATLASPSTTNDAQTLARRGMLKIETDSALQAHPRR